MSYTLYYAPGAASLAVHWMLLELETPFEARRVDLSVGQTLGDLRRLNPAGRVPVLVVDGSPRTESAALLMLLAERHPDAGLAPSPGSPSRAAWLEAMVRLANGLLPPFRDWFYADADGTPEDAEAVRRLARRRIEVIWETLEGDLADGRPFLLGDRLSTVDFLATMLMRWSRGMPRPATSWPGLADYVIRMRARPAYLKLHRAEALEGWVNSDHPPERPGVEDGES